MVDMFPFPKVNGHASEKEQISELISYLIQFKETLEFALMNISGENLSADLVKKLNALGADIQQSKMDREDEITQISINSLTISDVQKIVEKHIDELEFNVNFDTGNLEYTTKKEENTDGI